MKRIDPWEANLNVLGLPKESSWEQVQTRYRKLVLAFHPDINRGDAGSADRFRAVARSYERLKELKREREEESMEHFAPMSEDPRLSALSIDELGMRITYSRSPRVRAAAAYLLGRIESKESRRLLLLASRDRDAKVRHVALEVLARVGTPADLLRCMTNQGPKRWGVAGTLILLSAHRCVQAIARSVGRDGRGETRIGGKLARMGEVR